jgi:hypothetical protein
VKAEDISKRYLEDIEGTYVKQDGDDTAMVGDSY